MLNKKLGFEHGIDHEFYKKARMIGNLFPDFYVDLILVLVNLQVAEFYYQLITAVFVDV